LSQRPVDRALSDDPPTAGAARSAGARHASGARLTTRELTATALFAALIAIGAFVTVPLGTVPFTLQVLFVLLAGMVLGPRLGAGAVIVYLLLGLVVPVYAGGTSGLGVLLGPTGGYLLGFVPAAVLAGLLACRGRATLLRFVAAGVLGLVPIYALGATWLAVQLHLTPAAAITTGVTPFIAVDLAKAAVAGLAARSLTGLPLALPALQRNR
jgi:biotin transport system substrate-specific component